MEFGDATREVERRLDRVGEPALDPFAQDKTVDDNGDVVRLIALELEFVLLVEIDELPVDDGTDEPLAGEVGKQGVVGALSALDDRSEDLESSPSSIVKILSTICWGVWRTSSSPVSGSCGIPIRANRRRR